MKLYLDDVRMPLPEFTLVKSVREAIRMVELFDAQITHMSLDHDLGICYCRSCAFSDADEPCLNDNGEVSCGCTCHVPEPTGMDFLKWIHETGHWPPNRPLVHSANRPAAVRMEAFINDFGPYGPAPQAAP